MWLLVVLKVLLLSRWCWYKVAGTELRALLLLPPLNPCTHSMRWHCAQSCVTLCDPMDCSLPGSSVHGIFQTRNQEWVAISFSKEIPSLAEEGMKASNGLSHFAIVPQTGVEPGWGPRALYPLCSTVHPSWMQQFQPEGCRWR